jgi:hypothetical protein
VQLIAVGLPTARREAEELREWRLSALRVTNTWNAWLAAEGSDDRRACYRDFEAALADEERAAGEVERMFGPALRERAALPMRP